MRSGIGPDDGDSNRAKMSGNTGQKCPKTPGENVLQTYYRNPSYKPISPEPASEHVADNSKSPSSETAPDGLLKGEEAGPINRNYLSREKGTTGSSRAEAAWSAAEYRLDNAIAALDTRAKAAVWNWLDECSLKAAVRAEMGRRGGGMAFISAGIRMDRLNGVEGSVHVH